ncbi:MAG: Uma2 family endonuclease, partial [Armatimonadetes bacterium]|nr:Uma2 family endonuclease [Armatimonadota bacterium]
LYFADNTLELWMPSEAHEELNRMVALLIALIYGEWDVEARDLGSMTHSDPATDRGFEPDTCFYEDVETGGETVSRPRLAVEMERTNSALAKLPIYAAYGMPEVWRVSLSDTGELQARFYRLEEGDYREVSESIAVPPMTPDLLCDFLRARLTATRLGAWIASVQNWARARPHVSA